MALNIIKLMEGAKTLKAPLISYTHLNYNAVRAMYEMMAFPFFTAKKEYNLNIGALRSTDLTVDVYNDLVWVAWEWQGKGHIEFFKATTDPGLYYLLHPMNPKGTAILVPGYYKSVYSIGIHRRGTPFAHTALIQVKEMNYWRVQDYQQTSQLPINQKEIHTEIAKTNLHSKPRHYSFTDNNLIGKTSGGCTVVEDNKQFHDVFIPLVNKAAKNFGNKFSFGLFYEPYILEKF